MAEKEKTGRIMEDKEKLEELVWSSTVKYEKVPEKRLAYITFDRPESLNAMTMGDEVTLREKVIEAENDEDVKVIIFRGAGRCFGSGLHVAALGPHMEFGKSGDERRPSQRSRLLFDKHYAWGRDGAYQTVLRCAKPTIAQVHGYCYGSHFHVLLASDIAIVADNALFTHPGFRYIGPLYTQALCIAIMGVRKTKEMMLTGRRLSAQEALECGLVNKVVPLDKLEEEVLSMAELINLMPMDALVMGKAFFDVAFDILGIGPGLAAGSVLHALQTNVRLEPDEFNLFKARKDKGISGALHEKEEYYRKSPISVRLEEKEEK